MSRPFGNVLLVTPRNLVVLFARDVLLGGLVVSCGRQLAAARVDEEFARARGLPTGRSGAPGVAREAGQLAGPDPEDASSSRARKARR
jgi:hypothetical protein